MENKEQSFPIDLPAEEIAVFCKKWKIQELAFFGSVIRDDFGPDSDVDVLVTFSPTAQWTLLDHVSAQMELSDLLGRKVDLLTRRAVENSHNEIRRGMILGEAKVYYSNEKAA